MRTIHMILHNLGNLNKNDFKPNRVMFKIIKKNYRAKLYLILLLKYFILTNMNNKFLFYRKQLNGIKAKI